MCRVTLVFTDLVTQEIKGIMNINIIYQIDRPICRLCVLIYYARTNI